MSSIYKWIEEEINLLNENYERLGPDKCSKLLSRSKRACTIKAKELGLKYINNRYEKINLLEIVNNSKNKSECLYKLGLNSKSAGNFDGLNKYIKLYEIDISHFSSRTDGLKTHINNITKTLEEILVENSTYNRGHLKNRLYKENIKERYCELCNQGEEWNGKKMSLILDHVNGISDDNRLINLRIVCPNCNATLETHCKGNRIIKDIEYKNKCNCGKEKWKTSKQCEECSYIKQRKVERPTLEQILKDIEETNYVLTGKKYGVSDNSIRKWIKNYMES